MRKVIVFTGTFAAAVALAGCGGEDGSPESPPPAAPAPLLTVERSGPDALPVITQPGRIPGSTTPPPPGTTVTLTLTMKGGKPVGGRKHWKVAKGKRVMIVVGSDRADRVHLHGYDVAADVAPGKAARLSFKATIPGRFELESHGSDLTLAELEVR